ENIFEPNTPLHDGAVVVRGTRIVSAGCFLPLTEENSISKQLGTRHRAALGVTENTDAIALVVSEETGTISMAHSGKLTRHLGENALRNALHALYEPQAEVRFKGFMQRVYALMGGQKDEQ
ncbi:MAG: diadenylate cyclase, partial [Christensenellaceae bacterium]|nr:diadenylate cyclase [Christensenellaceae bacterium]